MLTCIIATHTFPIDYCISIGSTQPALASLPATLPPPPPLRVIDIKSRVWQ